MLRQIEMYVGYPDHGDAGTWDTRYIGIPDETPDDQVDAVANQTLRGVLEEHDEETAFFGVYCIPKRGDGCQLADKSVAD